MPQMVNRVCESFGKYRVIKFIFLICFIYITLRHYTAILQNFGLHIFYFWTPQFG